MNKNPFNAFLDVYVDHLLDEPEDECRSKPETKPTIEPKQEPELEKKFEPISRSLCVLFAEIDSIELPFKEVCDLPAMMLFDSIEPEKIIVEDVAPDTMDDTFVVDDTVTMMTESAPSRLSMQERLTDSSFQTLIFEISGVKMAVPLVDLGGIHPFVPLQHIIGKPDWYAGFVQLKGKSVNCIDGAKWLLTDKRLSNENAPEYKFIIMLNDTNWGIACHNLVDTVLMFTTEVKWRDIDIKRPWMAGLVKEQMCAMLDTYQLTDMLDAGLNSDQK